MYEAGVNIAFRRVLILSSMGYIWPRFSTFGLWMDNTQNRWVCMCMRFLKTILFFWSRTETLIYSGSYKDKTEEVWLNPVTNAPYTYKIFKKAKWQHKNAAKKSITQRLHTDLWQSVGETAASQPVWLIGSRMPKLPTTRNSCNIRRLTILLLKRKRKRSD